MILPTLTFRLHGVEISMPPLDWTHWLLMSGVALIAYGLAWLIRGFRIRSLRKAAIRREAEHSEILAAQIAAAEMKIIEGQRLIDDARGDKAVLEERFAIHREATQRHEKEAHAHIIALESELAAARQAIAQIEPLQLEISELEKAQAVIQERLAAQREAEQKRELESQARISALEADLAATREQAVHLQATKARIVDLEAMVTSERGRRESLEQMVTVTTHRAEDLEARLTAARQKFAEYELETRDRHAELNQTIAERDQAKLTDAARVEKAEGELAKLRETHASYQQQAETRIANLQRSLSAAEAKTTVVQKEFMSALGVYPEKLPLANGDKLTDRRVRELEDRVAQVEADSRKKAREDSYKIAELEYRLSEAKDALTRASGGAEPS